MIRNDATLRQIAAAAPDKSTWLSANAGSGKTRVLTDRVARLLLDGVQPQHILCLTYTKAAASEMQNRLFKRLGKWSMLADPELRADLLELGYDADITSETLLTARRLFARAIETPGGLKIQTIHSFCSSLLRRFPLEAKVSPQFTEMDDRSAEMLRDEILDDMAKGTDRHLVDGLAIEFTGAEVSSLTADIVRAKELLSKPPSDAELNYLLGLSGTETIESILSNVFSFISDSDVSNLISVLSRHSTTMVKIAEQLKTVDWNDPKTSDLQTLWSLFLMKDGLDPKTKSVPTKKAAEELGEDFVDLLHQWMHEIALSKNTVLAMKNRSRTKVLYDFAERFLEIYGSRKTFHGWLDFDDLILKARALLTDPLVAQWVLFRLDGGIDHILVDEAQDTSPAQWDVIQLLAEEFTTGEGTRDDVARTIFVVGDKKQSIYSFQGADPASFDRMREEFRERLTAVGKDLQNLTLDYSFRSSSPVLNLVDKTFVDETADGVGKNLQHLAFHDAMPGRVDLWPIQPKDDAEDSDLKWYEPLDRKSARNHNLVLAEKIAKEISRMIAHESLPDGEGRRAISEGDFLVLVQRRSPLFHEIIRACKNEGLSIAGADRLKIAGELAVKDIAAVLEFLALPEDDLSLACALKSPLFGWTEQNLFDLAHRRTEKFLWQALRGKTDQYNETLDVLNDLRDVSDFLRPYDLIERLLTKHNGRERLLARLGQEAQDGIDALLAQALAYERNGVPSLTGFLSWMRTDDVEIKRQVDSASNQIRVMTVHGSKGLEAPIVIMPDTAKPQNRNTNEILTNDGVALWKPSKPDRPRAIDDILDINGDLANEERNRLLYVAMTRAEKWLIVCGAGDEKSCDAGWYGAIQTAMANVQTAPFTSPTGDALRFTNNGWDIGEFPSQTPADHEELCRLEFDPISDVPTQHKPLSPSDLGGSKTFGGTDEMTDEDQALRFGRQIHLLLEHFPNYPETQWPKLATSLFSHGENIADDNEISELVENASRILKSSELSHVFAKTAMAEVPITAEIPTLGHARIHGIVDRLIVEDNKVLAVDFKSNPVTTNDPAKIPEGVLRQMGAYLEALEQIYANKKIEVAVLWTRTAKLVPLPHDIVRKALSRHTSS